MGTRSHLRPCRPGPSAAGAPIVAMARTYDGHGAWLVNSEGHVYELGDARSYGSLSSGKAAQAPITSMASTPDGRGYWLLAASGQVYGFGDAHLQGMPNSYSAPYDAIVARPAGGYIITGADDGENYAYPGALVLGGGPGYTMSATLSGGASTPSGNGTWLTGRDGGVYTFGSGTGNAAVPFYGSVPGDPTSPSKRPSRAWLPAPTEVVIGSSAPTGPSSTSATLTSSATRFLPEHGNSQKWCPLPQAKSNDEGPGYHLCPFRRRLCGSDQKTVS